MGAAEEHFDDASDSTAYDEARGRSLALAPASVEVRRNGALLGAIGGVATAVAVAYLTRALQTGALLDWALTALMAAIGLVHLAGLVDARTPLLVADAQGVRVRLGRAWTGLTWGSLERVEHEQGGRLRDGRLLLVARNPERALDGLSGRSRRQTRWSERLYGEPLAVPLGLSTRASHRDDELTAALQDLAAGATLVVKTAEAATPDPQHDDSSLDTPAQAPLSTDERDEDSEGTEQRAGWRRVWRDPRPTLAETIDRVATSSTPAPLREAVRGRRTETTLSLSDPADSTPVGDDTQPVLVHTGDGTVRPLARAGSAVEPLVIDDFAVEPAADPVVGPELRAARTRLGLGVDALAERTRIRPHVIEAMEVDDFEACGGDFYARGHLRTLARVLGVDVAPLLADYEERYAQAPVDPRRVFRAELASGGSIRGTRGGPNWSVLVAAVMALVLAWSVARLIMDSPVELRSAPALNGSAGPGNGARQSGPTVPVLIRAAGGGAHVVVRDGAGKVVFTGDIAYGQTKALEISPPMRVESSDGSVEVVVDGTEKGALGDTGQEATATYVVR